MSLCKNYLPLEKGWAIHLNKHEFTSPKEALCQVWLKLAQWFWRRRFLNFVNVFLLFRNYLPWEKGGPFLNKFVSGLIEVGSMVLENKIFLIASLYFHYFLIISPWNRVELFIWTNLNPFHPTMLCAKFVWNWSGGSGEEDENMKSLRQRRQRQHQR